MRRSGKAERIGQLGKHHALLGPLLHVGTQAKPFQLFCCSSRYRLKYKAHEGISPNTTEEALIHSLHWSNAHCVGSVH